MLKKICRVLGFRVLGFQSSALLFDGGGFRVLVFGASLYSIGIGLIRIIHNILQRSAKPYSNYLGTCIRSTTAFGSRWLGFQMRGCGVYGYGV